MELAVKVLEGHLSFPIFSYLSLQNGRNNLTLKSVVSIE